MIIRPLLLIAAVYAHPYNKGFIIFIAITLFFE